jgi:hypothetical protein
MIYVDLETLTDRPFGRIMPSTAWAFYQIVDRADSLEFYWSGLSNFDHERRKRYWWDRYALSNRNPLVLTYDARPLAANNLLITRDLNLARLWAINGGNAKWIDNDVWHDASGTDSQWMARVAVGVLNASHN